MTNQPKEGVGSLASGSWVMAWPSFFADFSFARFQIHVVPCRGSCFTVAMRMAVWVAR